MSESDTRYSVTRTGGRTFRVAAARKGGANDLTAALAEAAGDTPEFQAGYQAAQRYLAFGRALRTLREAHGMTQKALSERTGIDQADLSRIENGVWGKRGISVLTMERILAELGHRLEFSIVPIEQASGQAAQGGEAPPWVELAPQGQRLDASAGARTGLPPWIEEVPDDAPQDLAPGALRNALAGVLEDAVFKAALDREWRAAFAKRRRRATLARSSARPATLRK